jgi:short-subunit dehydrogenase
MAKTIVVCGYGPGISSAVAHRFGREGFAVALVGRDAQRVASGVAALEREGVRAAAFPTDLRDEAAVERLVAAVRAQLGPITVLHWNAYARDAGDLLQADAAATRAIFELPVTELLVAVKAALPDLKNQQDAAVLVTNGGFGLNDPRIDARAVALGAMGLAVANAAKHKLVGLLAQQLRPLGVYVGEVMVLASVKGSAWDDGTATLEASKVGDAFYELFSSRTDVTRNVA